MRGPQVPKGLVKILASNGWQFSNTRKWATGYEMVFSQPAKVKTYSGEIGATVRIGLVHREGSKTVVSMFGAYEQRVRNSVFERMVWRYLTQGE